MNDLLVLLSLSFWSDHALSGLVDEEGQIDREKDPSHTLAVVFFQV